MRVARTYRCSSCGHKWRVVGEASSQRIVDCPHCDQTHTDKHYEVAAPAIGGSVKSRAVDVTYKMLESDYGMTDLKDNCREGDIAAKIPVAPEMSAELQRRGGFFGSGKPSDVSAGRQSALSIASAAKAERMQQGVADPVGMFQNTLKKAGAPSVIEATRRNPVARG